MPVYMCVRVLLYVHVHALAFVRASVLCAYVHDCMCACVHVCTGTSHAWHTIVCCLQEATYGIGVLVSDCLRLYARICGHV